jgi:hypothetical protein
MNRLTHSVSCAAPGSCSASSSLLPSLLALLLSALFVLATLGCNQSRNAEPEKTPAVAPSSASQSPAQDSAQLATAKDAAVKAEFRNVMFHLTPDAAAHLQSVSGELWPVGEYAMPVFDDKTSFDLHISQGTVSITPEALASVLNSYVFARTDAPLKDISVEMKEGRLIIKGKLHRKGDLPFETAVDISVEHDGRLRLHTEKVKALKVPVKKVMSLFGIELANVINTSKIPGMDTDKNDVIVDLATLLPPPHIRGRIASAHLERNAIVVVYGGGKTTAASAEAEQGGAALSGNYMLFSGHRVKFGKLTMEDTDLAVIDLDPKDPLDWYQDRYKDQLVAGNSKITDKFGLRAYVKDFTKLARRPAAKPTTDDTN